MATSTRMGLTTLTLGALVVAGACRGREEARVDTAVSGGAIAGATAVTTAPPGAMTDANIAAILDEANASDSTMGAMAVEKGKSDDVKSFGRLMMGEHHALRMEGQQLATRLGVTPQAPPTFEMPNRQRMTMDSLKMLSGTNFDRAYIAHEVAFHEQVMQTLQTARNQTQNAELRTLLEKAQPVIQKHLDRAREIQTKLGTGTT